jgi:hypothetical protein
MPSRACRRTAKEGNSSNAAGKVGQKSVQCCDVVKLV